MAKAVRITAGSLTFDGELNDTATARRIYEALPIEGSANRWGDEIYFGIPVTAGKSDPMRTEMSVGELAFWPAGSALCIFWGPTPASQGDEPRAAGDVVPVGKLFGVLTQLSEVKDGQAIHLDRRPDCS